ncbi:MAG: hypothetical protein ACFCGT_14780 [Sandaracinaceae bacterium]
MIRTRCLTAAFLVLVSVAAVPACTLEGTGGDLVPVEFSFAGGHDSRLGPLVTETLYDPPWTVRLDEARIVLGAAYVFPPPAEPLSTWSPASLFVSRARAHGGDDNLFAVTALAETLEPVVIDALDPTPRVIGPILGEANLAREVSVWIDAPRGEAAGAEGPTHGFHGWVKGTASSGDRTVPFEAGITLAETPLSQRVDRIALRGGPTELVAGSRVAVDAVADEWLDQVDFDGLLDSGQLVPDLDGVYRPAEPNGFQGGWLINFHDPDAFRARITQGEVR